MDASTLEVPTDLALRMSRPGPRYTSYPTANLFHDRVGPATYAAALGRLGASGRPASVYVHVPFCRMLCHYCACNVVVTRKASAAEAYLEDLRREVDLVAAALGRPVPVTQLHLGGGTPTFLTSAQLRTLHATLAARLDLSAVEEQAIEVDPRVTAREQLETLASLGWNRLSIGVQDLDPRVQRAINRVQPMARTQATVEDARALGFSGVNVDLIFGLPFQTLESFERTLAAVVQLRPDRIALYSYAHVPWMRPAQRRFETKGYPLPGPELKLDLLRLAVATLEGAGWVHLGMDHFALPGDELARARARGALHRNFQGYTVRRADDLVALGPSAISDVDGVYAQNHKDVEPWAAALAGGRLATERGWELTDDDRLRRDLIGRLMVGAELPADVERQVPDAAAGLEACARDGLLARDAAGRWGVTPRGRFFLRNVAMAFDRHLTTPTPDRPVFSKTV